MKLLKKIWWEIKQPNHRYAYAYYFIRDLPGHLGEKLRSTLTTRHLKSHCGHITLHRNVTLQGIDHLSVGENVAIGEACILQSTGGIVLEDDVMIGPGVKIWSVNHNYSNPDRSIYEQGYTHEQVTIKKGVWLGANVFVMPGVTLPEGCVVCAGSIVNKKKYKPYSILSGNPCRMIGTRIKQEPLPTVNNQSI